MRSWRVKVHKMKATYHVLNMLNIDVSQNCLVGEFWAAVNDLPKIEMTLKRATVE